MVMVNISKRKRTARMSGRGIQLLLMIGIVIALIWSSNPKSIMDGLVEQMKQSYPLFDQEEITVKYVPPSESVGLEEDQVHSDKQIMPSSVTAINTTTTNTNNLQSPEAQALLVEPIAPENIETLSSSSVTTKPSLPSKNNDTQQNASQKEVAPLKETINSKVLSNETNVTSSKSGATPAPAQPKKEESTNTTKTAVSAPLIKTETALARKEESKNTTKTAVTAPLIKAETAIEPSLKEDPAVVLKRVTEPWANVSTMTYFQHKFYSGYRNQMMSFTVFVMEAARQNISQILLASLLHKDTFGNNKMVCHEQLFDVVHWNSQYPKLPRLVTWDADMHDQVDYRRYRPKFLVENPELNSARPIVYGRQSRLLIRYKMYSKGRGEYAKPHFRNPVELAMIRGGIRPHPDLQDILDNLLLNASMTSSGVNTTKIEYMTLHARVEPDMQVHTACKNQKERNLTQIFKFVEQKFPDPPAPLVFMPVNRQEMERFVKEERKKPQSKQNALAIENLEVFNKAAKDGLWNGRARIIEFGAHSLIGTTYENRRSIAGSILNFYIALGGNVFIGTEVSSYSSDLVTSRFYRGEMRNYKYLPEQGLVEWTPKGMKHAPDFHC